MTPDPITRLNAALEGRYRIEREIGEGGMATVYLAEDLRHERKVALKVLKPELAAVVGAERFLAEIKTTANLQHPHILPLHDSGEADGFLHFVMPYIEGDTLRDKIDREKQLSVGEALKITEKVASALDYAHKHGVVHRDIKPGNILLSAEGEPTVADFGIALAVAQAGGGRVTETGLSIGTPHYMSPEQATGDRDVDPRADVYALGCVLYEMLTGEPPYQGGTAQAVLAKILTDPTPAPTRVRVSIPPNVDAAIRKALEQLPADRFASAADFARALGDPGFRHGEEGVVHIAPSDGVWRPWALVTTVLALAFAVTTAWALLRPESPQPVSRQVLSTQGWTGLDAQLGRYAAMAPDGSSMILPVDGQLALKMAGSTEITPIPGTEGGRDVVYSPDGQWLAYAVDLELFKRPIVGGSPVRLAEDADNATFALDWLEDGTILYEQFIPGLGDPVLRQRRIVQIPEDGGEPRVVFWPEDEQVAPVWVSGIPNARGALVIACSVDTSQTVPNCGVGQANLFIVDLRDLSYDMAIGQVARAWVTPTGQLVYVRADGALFAAPFDLGALEITGPAIPLFDGVRVTGGWADMRLAADGTLLYVEGDVRDAGLTELVLVDREGNEESLGFEPGTYAYPRFSPEGDRLAVAVPTTGSSDIDLWVLDLNRGSRTRITYGGNNAYFPTWMPEGDRLTFADGNQPPTNTLLIASADGTGQPEPLLVREGLQYPTSWSSEGVLVYYENAPETARDLWVLPRGGEPTPVLIAPFEDRRPAFSPDGHWLAYMSNRSGQYEIYVRPYPGPGPEVTVSTEGGTGPVWSPDGSELFYRTPDQLMVVTVGASTSFRAGTPRALFADPYLRDGNFGNYDIAPDGEHFVMVKPAGQASGSGGEQSRLILVQNFFEELRQVVPER